MSDRYSSLVNSPIGGRVAAALGLPRPVPLRRYDMGAPLVPGLVFVGGHGAAPLAAGVRRVVEAEGVGVVGEVAAHRLAAIVLDMSQVATPADLESLRAVLAPGLRALEPGGRVVVLGRPPYAGHSDAALGAARRALEGITRSVGKELRGGSTANLVLVAEGADEALDSTLRFLLTGRSAYVSGQVITVGATRATAPAGEATAVPASASWSRPLAGTVAFVTGAARGIGAAIATVLARDGARVVCVDVPAAAGLDDMAAAVGGSALPLDITDPDAGARIVAHCAGLDGATGPAGLDIVVHNAGITRDRLLVNTDADRWRQVIDVNLMAVLRMNEALLGPGGLRDGGRLVLVSSTSGIAGNRGQANYAASKAGLIGVVGTVAQDPALIGRGITINAVAPGLIETDMTARIPLAMREVGPRINSLAQGGLPVDVAETVAYFAQGASGAVSGNVLRVCGQSQLGA